MSCPSRRSVLLRGAAAGAMAALPRLALAAAANDPNNITGAHGVFAIDKIGQRALILDARHFAIKSRVPLPPRPHEFAISLDRRRAYVPIYDPGIFGANARPDHRVAVVDLERGVHSATFELSPYKGAHSIAVGPRDGLLYVACDASGVIAVVEPQSGRVTGAIPTGSPSGSHVIAMLPDNSKIYAENEDRERFVSVMDVQKRALTGRIAMPDGAMGIDASPDGWRVLVVDAGRPELAVIDTQTDRIVRRVRMKNHDGPVHRALFSPDGRYVVVTDFEHDKASILDAAMTKQATVSVGKGPMGVGFHPDGRTALIANHNAGTITVLDLQAAQVTGEVDGGEGIETLSFF